MKQIIVALVLASVVVVVGSQTSIAQIPRSKDSLALLDSLDAIATRVNAIGEVNEVRYLYGLAIRATSGNPKLIHGDFSSDDPDYTMLSNKGQDGIRMGRTINHDWKLDARPPQPLSYRIKVISETDKTAKVELAIRLAFNVELEDGLASWNEKVWHVEKEVRWDKTETLHFEAPKESDFPNLEVRFRVKKMIRSIIIEE